MLKISHVTRRFGDKIAVNDVTLDIPQGQMVGIIGRSGAGKSTLLRMINRLNDVSSGYIEFDGSKVSALKGQALRNWQRDCAMIFQQFNLVPRLDVITNVMLGRLNGRNPLLNLLQVFSADEQLEALKALERLDIAPTAMQWAQTLSGGQQQRVAIARALMQQPKMILADEPIASLDPRNAQIVMDSLRDINAEGITVITNLHTLDTARAYCERIIGMAQGKVVFDGTPGELTTYVARSIYGADGLKEAFSEAMTSTAIAPVQFLPRTPTNAQQAPDPAQNRTLRVTKGDPP
ncbi:phosphonate ABC transporter ATP-binding protein [Devosia aurantiaca]|uniref:Phosphonate ABC transporter ATP-binding protein n=1 Tax=Devosia aurantiaca TaxID=2714858 RepID=A0A6M1SAX1_9HYPH|nr:phosphonate ABC transporter ATP-binding protein [Devosia aurantiaca]NGP16907.1 phosphonate ABC transporter ATP-binding protein [Devosia aurantiaca]